MSGSITITPAKQFGPGDLQTRAGLNQLGTPIGQIDEGAVSPRELDDSINDKLSFSGGSNLFCNGDFNVQDYATYDVVPSPTTGEVFAGLFDHAYGPCNRWLMANDDTRTVSIERFTTGQTDVPDAPIFYYRWMQASPLVVSPAYFGQRIEQVRRFAGRSITLSIWVRPTASLTLTPNVRQYFGPDPLGSPAVITAGSAKLVAANVWTKITQTFAVPSIAGKTVQPDETFTEVRLDVPAGIAFQIDWAHAQCEIGSVASRFDARAPQDEQLFAGRYFQVLNFMLSDDITVWQPSVMTRYRMMRSPNIIVTPASGTGATFGEIGTEDDTIVQTADHTAIVSAQVVCEAELYDTP